MNETQVPHKPQHPKQEFQVERLAFFSDAVFAIAITLLIIEFRVPVITKDSTWDSVWEQLVEMKYKLLALCISFMLIANYWIKHHALFKHIHSYNQRIVISNMYILLPVIFFPFSTAFFAESVDNENVMILGLRLFLLNHIAANITLFVFYWLTFVYHKDLSYGMERDETLKFRIETLFPMVSFLICLGATFFTRDMRIFAGIIIGGLFLKRLTGRYYGVKVR